MLLLGKTLTDTFNSAGNIEGKQKNNAVLRFHKVTYQGFVCSIKGFGLRVPLHKPKLQWNNYNKQFNKKFNKTVK